MFDTIQTCAEKIISSMDSSFNTLSSEIKIDPPRVWKVISIFTDIARIIDSEILSFNIKKKDERLLLSFVFYHFLNRYQLLSRDDVNSIQQKLPFLSSCCDWLEQEIKDKPVLQRIWSKEQGVLSIFSIVVKFKDSIKTSKEKEKEKKTEDLSPIELLNRFLGEQADNEESEDFFTSDEDSESLPLWEKEKQYLIEAFSFYKQLKKGILEFEDKQKHSKINPSSIVNHFKTENQKLETELEALVEGENKDIDIFLLSTKFDSFYRLAKETIQSLRLDFPETQAIQKLTRDFLEFQRLGKKVFYPEIFNLYKELIGKIEKENFQKQYLYSIFNTWSYIQKGIHIFDEASDLADKESFSEDEKKFLTETRLSDLLTRENKISYLPTEGKPDIFDIIRKENRQRFTFSNRSSSGREFRGKVLQDYLQKAYIDDSKQTLIQAIGKGMLKSAIPNRKIHIAGTLGAVIHDESSPNNSSYRRYQDNILRDVPFLIKSLKDISLSDKNNKEEVSRRIIEGIKKLAFLEKYFNKIDGFSRQFLQLDDHLKMRVDQMLLDSAQCYCLPYIYPIYDRYGITLQNEMQGWTVINPEKKFAICLVPNRWYMDRNQARYRFLKKQLKRTFDLSTVKFISLDKYGVNRDFEPEAIFDDLQKATTMDEVEEIIKQFYSFTQDTLNLFELNQTQNPPYYHGQEQEVLKKQQTSIEKALMKAMKLQQEKKQSNMITLVSKNTSILNSIQNQKTYFSEYEEQIDHRRSDKKDHNEVVKFKFKKSEAWITYQEDTNTFKLEKYEPLAILKLLDFIKRSGEKYIELGQLKSKSAKLLVLMLSKQIGGLELFEHGKVYDEHSLNPKKRQQFKNTFGLFSQYKKLPISLLRQDFPKIHP